LIGQQGGYVASLTPLGLEPATISTSSYSSSGLIARTPNSNTYFLTPHGLRVALFYTKVHDRLLTPLLGADKPPAPLPLRRALHTIDQHVDSYIDHARLRLAA